MTTRPGSTFPMAEQSSIPSPTTASAFSSHGSLEELERQEIEASLRRNGWVQARAARELGLTQRQIGYRIKKFNLQRPDFIGS